MPWYGMSLMSQIRRCYGLFQLIPYIHSEQAGHIYPSLVHGNSANNYTKLAANQDAGTIGGTRWVTVTITGCNGGDLHFLIGCKGPAITQTGSFADPFQITDTAVEAESRPYQPNQFLVGFTFPGRNHSIHH